jgi:hypothetical protein
VRRLESSGESEIPSTQIGELVMDALRALDKVAYVRFASVYRNFREAKDFEEFIGKLGGRRPPTIKDRRPYARGARAWRAVTRTHLAQSRVGCVIVRDGRSSRAAARRKAAGHMPKPMRRGS